MSYTDSIPFFNRHLIVKAEVGRVTEVFLAKNPLKKKRTSVETQRALQQIKNYLSTPQFKIDFEVEMKGTPFQKKVWRVLEKIPPGKTLTYSQVAEKIGHPGAARAVGTACGANSLLLRVPCHRVVAKKGLGGFALDLNIKEQLLKNEGVSDLNSLVHK